MIIFILTLLLVKIVSSLNETLLFVFQINRNGARAPYSGVNKGKDLYLEKWVSNGELSNVGKRQEYLLGVSARKKYIIENHLLSENYNPNEIYIKSIDSNRTIESIYSFIQGLYPSGTGEIINEIVANNINITYPPNNNTNYSKKFENIIQEYSVNNRNSALPNIITILPIHIFYEPEHQIKLYDLNNCPGIKDIFEEHYKRNEIINIAHELIKENKDFFIDLEKRYSNNKIIEDKFLEDYWTLYRYMDNFVCDENDKRNFSNFNNEFSNYSKYLHNLKNISTKFIKEEIKVKKENNKFQNISIVDVSYTLRNVLNWMNQAKTLFNKAKKKYIKYVIYSTHGLSIEMLDIFMSYFFNISIDDINYAESRFFELYVNKENIFNVRYLKGDNIKMNATFNDFNKIVKNKTWTEYYINKFCFPNTQNKKTFEINIFGASIMIILSLLDGILIVILILEYNKKK